MKPQGVVRQFMLEHYKHFNAGTLVDAAKAYEQQLLNGHKMMITLAGAMSTAELGKSLAEMIRQEKVHIICCTGANLEEDVFNLVAHQHYKRIPDYRNLSPEQELALLENHLNRVTDTCIPEEEAMRAIENHLIAVWDDAYKNHDKYFPHEYFYQILLNHLGPLDYQIDHRDSWILAAAERNLPIIVPGWEDSTCGNFFAGHCIEGRYTTSILKSGIDYMMYLARWYEQQSGDMGVGFFQIGGGISGDFPICVVPMLHQDLGKKNVPVWSYFCQISDSTTSYGSYSGAVPNEKITWGKLSTETPKFIIESDATIVAPLLFAFLLNW